MSEQFAKEMLNNINALWKISKPLAIKDEKLTAKDWEEFTNGLQKVHSQASSTFRPLVYDIGVAIESFLNETDKKRGSKCREN